MAQSAGRGPLVIKFIVILCFCASAATAQNSCPRPIAGSQVIDPPVLRSHDGVLEATLFFRSSKDSYDQTRYCYVTKDGLQSPTLRVNRGDSVILHLKNEVVGEPTAKHVMPGGCTASAVSPQSTNLHFHGLSIPPVCHQDEVLTTMVGPGAEAYDYRFQIPVDQSPGLYWYHPHPHGFTEAQVLGGASGALIVNGIEQGLRERVLVLRDQLQPGEQLNYMEPAEESEKDVSVNFVPVTAPLFIPAVIEMAAGEKEFWRVLNASADTYFDLQYPMEIVALDGAPLAEVNHAAHVLIPPGGRAEFIVTPGTAQQLISNSYDTGPDGENTPGLVLATVINRGQPLGTSTAPLRRIDSHPELPLPSPLRIRKLYLSEDRQDVTKMPGYFITEEGATPRVFDMMSNQPEITVEQGTVEDWLIENRAHEAHTFHIHQLHFQVVERDGHAVKPVMRDTIDLPYWDGKGAYPSVKLRMDFRSPLIVGTFVYHCHILEHEDNGMMGRVRIVNGK